MKEKMKLALGSYVRSFVVAVLALVSAGVHDWQVLLIAGLSAVAGPLIRSLNPKDPAFGLVADVVEVELDKLAKATKKKRSTKKK